MLFVSPSIGVSNDGKCLNCKMELLKNTSFFTITTFSYYHHLGLVQVVQTGSCSQLSKDEMNEERAEIAKAINGCIEQRNRAVHSITAEHILRQCKVARMCGALVSCYS